MPVRQLPTGRPGTQDRAVGSPGAANTHKSALIPWAQGLTETGEQKTSLMHDKPNPTSACRALGYPQLLPYRSSDTHNYYSTGPN